MSRNKRYDEGFKKTIVNLYNSGKRATELSREYGLFNSTRCRALYNLSNIWNECFGV